VNPDLVARDEEGKAYTVRYDAINAMLLNEFLKEHRKVEQLEDGQNNVARLEVALAEQKRQIETLTSALQKVSERMEVGAGSGQLATTAH